MYGIPTINSYHVACMPIIIYPDCATYDSRYVMYRIPYIPVQYSVHARMHTFCLHTAIMRWQLAV